MSSKLKQFDLLAKYANSRRLETASKVLNAVSALKANGVYPSLRAICAEIETKTGRPIAVTTILRNPDAYSIYRSNAVTRKRLRATPGFYDRGDGEVSPKRRRRARQLIRKVKSSLILALLDCEEKNEKLQVTLLMLQEENLRLQMLLHGSGGHDL